MLHKEEAEKLQEDMLDKLLLDVDSWKEEQKEDFKVDKQPPKKAKTGLGKLLSGMYSKPTKKTSVREQTEDEIKRYVDEEPPDIDINPLTWWKMHHSRFSRIAALARHSCNKHTL